MFKKLIAFLISCLYLFTADGQQISADSLQQQRADAQATYYLAFRAEHAFLYTGRAYAHYGPLEGHAYAYSPGWESGSVVYDGITYKNILLKYDLVQQLIVVQRPDGITQLSLQNRLVSGFSLGRKKFMQLQAVDNRGDSLNLFYELLSEGPMTLLAGRRKTIEDKIENMQIQREVYERITYYAYYDGRYFKIGHQNDFLDLVPGSKRELMQHLRKNNIRFRRNPEAALVAMADYYNQKRN